MIDVSVNEISQYDVIHSKWDLAMRSARLFVLRHNGEVFVGYGTDNEIDQVISVENLSEVEEASNYSGVMQSYCKYCRDFDYNQLPDNDSRPSLAACSTCHDHLRSKFETLLRENCSEVMANHF